ncbi:variant erythrocyte surface antigen-1 family protein [Babesia caballi]|uniref:Variant erythrocyte surface antigen-1 family protein n=1 Tax=Babesia caballi TaxID=5871 RepID=A0AAV4LS69_BABCB|nr:variant erythrocyte surface antigen-1 family protein [Babesia caballi]
MNGNTYKSRVNVVIRTLRKCVGTGQVPEGFGKLVEGIGNKVKDGFDKKINTGGGSDGKLNAVFSALKSIVTAKFNDQEHQGRTVVQDHTKVEDCISKLSFEQDNSENFRNLCKHLQSLFGKNSIKPSSSQLDENAVLNVANLIIDITNVGTQANSVSREIGNLKKGKFIDHANAAVFTAVRDAATAFLTEIKEPMKYTSFYNKKTNQNADWSNVTKQQDQETCAKIFLGCLPLYYQALTYIYWGCHEKGGGWGSQTLANGSMRSYFDSQGLLPLYVDKGKTAAHIAETALNKFSEFTQGMTKASPPSPFTYSTFTKELLGIVKTEQQTNLSSQCPLSALFHGASCYFQCQQITKTTSAGGTPRSIREMLYFLAALQFSPQYDAFDSYVTSLFRTMLGNPSGGKDDAELKLQVADSGITSIPGTPASSDTLSAADVKCYIASTFHLAPAFIGLVQEPSTSEDPWLQSLFSNSQFKLSIPSSGAGIFGALSNYAYALQFQLYFLYAQCYSTYSQGRGWRGCRFGSEINKGSKDPVISHTCGGFNCGSNQSTCNHGGTGNYSGCKHNKKNDPDQCGNSSNLSPLQAFLTDNLQGFSLSPSSTSGHLSDHPPGSMCHVKMGFDPKHLRQNAGTGNYIYSALGSFCSVPYTPLRQLCEKIGCLTKRTPRTLGDIFGFIWHLNGQLFKTRPTMNGLITKFGAAFSLPQLSQNFNKNVYSALNELWHTIAGSSLHSKPSILSRSFESMAPAIPFLYQMFMAKEPYTLPGTIFDLTQHCHNLKHDEQNNEVKHLRPDGKAQCSHSSSNPADLWSLYNPVGDKAKYPNCSNKNVVVTLSP